MGIVKRNIIAYWLILAASLLIFILFYKYVPIVIFGIIGVIIIVSTIMTMKRKSIASDKIQYSKIISISAYVASVFLIIFPIIIKYVNGWTGLLWSFEYWWIYIVCCGILIAYFIYSFIYLVKYIINCVGEKDPNKESREYHKPIHYITLLLIIMFLILASGIARIHQEEVYSNRHETILKISRLGIPIMDSFATAEELNSFYSINSYVPKAPQGTKDIKVYLNGGFLREYGISYIEESKLSMEDYEEIITVKDYAQKDKDCIGWIPFVFKNDDIESYIVEECDVSNSWIYFRIKNIVTGNVIESMYEYSK